jgi:uncharacterized protein YdeI (YjbR/CyaY-like superfamily)
MRGDDQVPVSRGEQSGGAVPLMKINFFRSPSELRKWFEKRHTTAREIWVGYYKKSSGEPSITWPESVDEALCVGWIDGIRKRVDESRYKICFTPRKPRSIWSTVNIRRVRALDGDGRMRPAGLAAFAARRENRSGIYSYEQRRAELQEPYAGMLRKNRAAWAFFEAQPPGFRKQVSWWVVSAKMEETRLKRLKKLVVESARGKRV